MTNQKKVNIIKDNEKGITNKKLSLMDFAEVFLTLPEASKHEVMGYAKCLYASKETVSRQLQATNC